MPFNHVFMTSLSKLKRSSSFVGLGNIVADVAFVCTRSCRFPRVLGMWRFLRNLNLKELKQSLDKALFWCIFLNNLFWLFVKLLFGSYSMWLFLLRMVFQLLNIYYSINCNCELIITLQNLEQTKSVDVVLKWQEFLKF